MKYRFRKAKLSKANKERLQKINGIIDEYARDNYTLTLRQLYYQLVSRNVIANKVEEYSKLSKLLREGRMCGVVDWDAIEDRLRVIKKPATWKSPKDILETAMTQYAKDRLLGQKVYVEVWVEKDALSQVVQRSAAKYQTPVLVSRGYNSVTAIYDAYKRYQDKIAKGVKVEILYLGDHDPSGLDMIRDIRNRVSFMIANDYANDDLIIDWWNAERDTPDVRHSFSSHKDYDELIELSYKKETPTREAKQEELYRAIINDLYVSHTGIFKVTPIALTKEQIDQYQPPPNPAKMKDPRSGDYVKKHGRISYEVDALEPKILDALIVDNLESRLNVNLYNSIKKAEDKERKKIKTLIKKIK